MQERCLEMARALTGAPEEDVLLEQFCALAWETLMRRLREGLGPMDCGGHFPLAVALLAAADWWASRLPEESGLSFRAGEVSVTARPPAEQKAAVQVLREMAWRAMSPYVADGTFCFQGV